jgi:hypothetical protein
MEIRSARDLGAVAGASARTTTTAAARKRDELARAGADDLELIVAGTAS